MDPVAFFVLSSLLVYAIGLIVAFGRDLVFPPYPFGAEPEGRRRFIDAMGTLGFQAIVPDRQTLVGTVLRATIGPDARKGELRFCRSGRAFLELTMPAHRGLRVSIRKRRLLDRITRGTKGALDLDSARIWTPDSAALKNAFRKNPDLQGAVRAALGNGIEQILIWDGVVKATTPARRLQPERYRLALEALAAIVRAFEPVGVHVRVLGGQRQGLPGTNGRVRCAYCHDELTGDEPELVACPACATVLHEGCWAEHGRCPVIGCEAREPERRRTSEN